MKRRLMGVGILFLVLIFVMVSCKTTGTDTVEDNLVDGSQTGTTTTETPKGISQDLIDALNAARVRADVARAMSIEVDGPVYFPDEWNETESQFILENNSVVEETEDAYRTVAGTYNGIALAFEDITANSIPKYAEACRDRMLEARSAAIATDIVDLSPERFLVAEEYAVNAEAAWEFGDYIMTIENAKIALPYYVALKTGADAYEARTEIEDRGFAFFDRDTFNMADEKGLLAIVLYDEGDIEDALISAQQALSGYNTVLRKAWFSLATQEGNAATGARKAAVDVKAPVAVKQEFDKADAIYRQGQASFRSEDYQIAAESYAQSVSMFDTVRELAVYKRDQAQAAIDAAEKKILESEHTAEEAEARLEGGAQ